jgi:feruloyl-CoA synthase
MSLSLFGDPHALAPRRAVREDRPDGSTVLRHPLPLQPHARCIGDWLEHWARHTPDAPCLAERAAQAPGGWRRLNWRELRAEVGRLAQGLLNLDLPAGQPVVVLSDNSIDHALLSLAVMHIGRTACTVSSAYSRLTRDFTRIHCMLDMLQPCLIYASDAAVYGAAAAEWPGQALRVFTSNAEQVPGAVSLASLQQSPETAQVAEALAAVRPDTHAKYLLTSGSTGTPKVVINTHRMLTANQQQVAQVWPFLNEHPLHLLDWLPWSHTFGANHNFNMVLAHGGSLSIDDGRPVPGLVEKTLANLREVKPNFYFNVPRGFDMLLPFLEQDAACAADVFARMEGVFYAGAALPQSTWERLAAVAQRVRPPERPLWFTSAWGSTETSPAVTTVHWSIPRAGCIGLPLPGVELKLVPNGGKLELRVRGPNIFPGYRGQEDATRAAFDEEGYYRIGDAGRWVDDADPTQGVAFDGRVAEDFKLSSGTWVSVGTLRVKAVSAFSPWVGDAVVTGHDREEIGLLLFPTPAAKALPAEALQGHLQGALQSLASHSQGSAQRITRVLVLAEPPSVDAGEITDKGYLNQRAVLTRRADAVAALYGEGPLPAGSLRVTLPSA